MRYRLRTLMIVLVLGPLVLAWYGPTVYEYVLDSFWWLAGGDTKQHLILGHDGQIVVNGKKYGRAKPGEIISTRSRGRVFVGGKLRLPEEP
jgi:hypothetical protein